VDIPVIASGGVGTLDHLVDGITLGKADAVLAASIFHFGEFTVPSGQGVHGRARYRDAAGLIGPVIPGTASTTASRLFSGS
jgi:hypothetical protein